MRAKDSLYGIIWSFNSCVNSLKKYENVHFGKSLTTIRRILSFPYSYIHTISLRRIFGTEDGTENSSEVSVIIYQSTPQLIPELLKRKFIFFRAGHFLTSCVTTITSRKAHHYNLVYPLIFQLFPKPLRQSRTSQTGTDAVLNSFLQPRSKYFSFQYICN